MKDPNAWKYTPRIDFLGNELKVGNKIACLAPYYRDLIVAEVLKITPMQIKIQILSNKGYTNRTIRYAEQVIKITEKQYEEKR